jgi:transcriptional regulator with AAA-type ATPase domain
MVRQGRHEEARRSLAGNGPPDLRDAFALGVIERLLGHQPWIDRQLRSGAIGVLERAGLSGWARVLKGDRGQRDRLIDAMSRLVEGGGIQDLPDDVAAGLFEAFHLSGLEVRSRAEQRLVCRWGRGVAGQATRRSRVELVPLGGGPIDDPAWRLLAGLVDLLAPEASVGGDGDGVETGIHGSSAAVRSLRRQLRLFAPTGRVVLVQGETGVGKEVAAQALHRLSGRRGRFVPVNVAAIPTELLEAELFGSKRGAYTGADRSRGGLVDAADRGTLFLDEIGDLEPGLQVKLLRFLESQEVRPVGSDAFHTVNVRIVSATHHDLERRIADGRFRHDLYYRIAAAPITVPPLRDRREDIPVLRELFEAEAVRKRGLRPCRWSPEAERMLAAYEWPGNVRELRHVIEVAMVRASGAVVLASHLPIEASEEAPIARWDEAMADFRRRYLRAALRRNAGNRSATARELGISRQTLLYHIRNLGLANLG